MPQEASRRPPSQVGWRRAPLGARPQWSDPPDYLVDSLPRHSDYHVADVRGIDPATVADYRGVIEGYLLPEFGELRLEAVTPDLIDAYKERLLAEGELSNRTVVRHLTVLHGIFKCAKRVWGLRENPASAGLVERPRIVYTGSSTRSTATRLSGLRERPRVPRTPPSTGRRHSPGYAKASLLALRWQHVDFVGGLLHVRRNFTGGVEKAPKGKRVPSGREKGPELRTFCCNSAQLRGLVLA